MYYENYVIGLLELIDKNPLQTTKVSNAWGAPGCDIVGDICRCVVMLNTRNCLRWIFINPLDLPAFFGGLSQSNLFESTVKLSMIFGCGLDDRSWLQINGDVPKGNVLLVTETRDRYLIDRNFPYPQPDDCVKISIV